jgi:hypothetical protein
MLHRLVESILWNRFLGYLKVVRALVEESCDDVSGRIGVAINERGWVSGTGRLVQTHHKRCSVYRKLTLSFIRSPIVTFFLFFLLFTAEA